MNFLTVILAWIVVVISTWLLASLTHNVNPRWRHRAGSRRNGGGFTSPTKKER